MDNSLYVGNLGNKTTEAELKDLFSEVGIVVNIIMRLDYQSNARKNYAFVNMETEEIAGAAVEHLNGHQLHGRPIRVTKIRIVEQFPPGHGLRREQRGWSGNRRAPR